MVALHRFKTPGVPVGFILFILHILSRRIGSSPAPSSQLEVPPGAGPPSFLPSGRASAHGPLFPPQDAVSALLARTSAELLAVEQELAQEDEEPGPGAEQRGPDGDW